MESGWSHYWLGTEPGPRAISERTGIDFNSIVLVESIPITPVMDFWPHEMAVPAAPESVIYESTHFVEVNPQIGKSVKNKEVSVL